MSQGFALLPHVPGGWEFSLQAMYDVYGRMLSEGTARTVFQDGSVQGPEEFYKKMTAPDTHFFMVVAEGHPAALCWLCRHQSRWAQFHYTSFKWTWGKLTTSMGRFVLKSLITMQTEEGFVWDAFLGITPKANRLAVRFLRKLGWQEIGEFPCGMWNERKRQSEPAIMSYFDRSCL